MVVASLATSYCNLRCYKKYTVIHLSLATISKRKEENIYKAILLFAKNKNKTKMKTKIVTNK